jgi:hypothetical protein
MQLVSKKGRMGRSGLTESRLYCCMSGKLCTSLNVACWKK